jgi:hypothetical protein
MRGKADAYTARFERCRRGRCNGGDQDAFRNIDARRAARLVTNNNAAPEAPMRRRSGQSLHRCSMQGSPARRDPAAAAG